MNCLYGMTPDEMISMQDLRIKSMYEKRCAYPLVYKATSLVNPLFPVIRIPYIRIELIVINYNFILFFIKSTKKNK